MDVDCWLRQTMTQTNTTPAFNPALIFQAPDPAQAQAANEGSQYAEFDESFTKQRKSKKTDKHQQRNGKKEQKQSKPQQADDTLDHTVEKEGTRRTRRRNRPEAEEPQAPTEITALKGSTRLEAKRQRRRQGRREGRKRHAITEAEFLARRESVDRRMFIREQDGLNQIAVTEDNILVEFYVARHTQTTMVGNVYVGKVQNVLPSMEAAFVDLGQGRNAVLYAGEVNWDIAGLQGRPRRIESALNPGDSVLVQVTKDPIGHKGARLTAQVTLAGRYLVFVPSGAMTGISRKLPEKERRRLKRLLKDIIPEGHGVIVRTAAEGASEEQLRVDVERLIRQWEEIEKKYKRYEKKAPALLHGEPELALRVVRDVFNEDFASMTVQGRDSWKKISNYVKEYAPDLQERMKQWVKKDDIFTAHRIDEQLAKGMDRKVWLPSGGYLIIDRTEAMTVIDVNTGKYTGSGGTLEETVTKNNLESAEEIVRQLRLRDIGGIIVIDFVDMVLEANRELVLRRLVECLGRDRTRHQVTEVTSLGLVQMTRKRVGQGLVEAFSTQCEACEGRGFIVHSHPVERNDNAPSPRHGTPRKGERHVSNAEWKAKRHKEAQQAKELVETDKRTRKTMAKIAQAAHEDEDAAPAKTSAPKKKTRTRQRTTNRRGPKKEPNITLPEAKATDDAQHNGSQAKTPHRRRRRRVVTSGPVDPSQAMGSDTND